MIAQHVAHKKRVDSCPEVVFQLDEMASNATQMSFVLQLTQFSLLHLRKV
jgi:ribosome-binding factor A